jgi:hypothetical protein
MILRRIPLLPTTNQEHDCPVVRLSSYGTIFQGHYASDAANKSVAHKDSHLGLQAAAGGTVLGDPLAHRDNGTVARARSSGTVSGRAGCQMPANTRSENTGRFQGFVAENMRNAVAAARVSVDRHPVAKGLNGSTVSQTDPSGQGLAPLPR